MSNASRHYGVLGRTLRHSYTPAIYRALADLDYRRFEREPGELEAFVRAGAWEGFNVTIPYKRSIMTYLDELSPIAQRLGNVNTVTRSTDGRLVGDNTDYFGFKVLVESLGVDLAGKKAVVFGGSGGAGSTAMAVLADAGAHPVAIGRTGQDTYADLARHADAALAVNCTPVGMFPHCPEAPCTLDALPNLMGVVDIVYNPARTGLVLEAEARGIAHVGGLLMLVAQAAQAVECYLGTSVDMARVKQVTAQLAAGEENIALIGMPGCGKTRVGEQLAARLGRTRVDIDQEIERRLGCSCAAYIEREGEDAFRAHETAVLRDVACGSGLVISCGGGVVTREENYRLLHQNSRIVMLDRPLDELAHKGRPITARDGVQALAEARMPRYRAWADAIIVSRDTAAHTAQAILAAIGDGIDSYMHRSIGSM